MADKTKIEWTDATWNPVTGCTRVSPGCDHCYIDWAPPFRIENRHFTVACPRCGGSGGTAKDAGTCRECDGEGQVRSNAIGSTTGVRLHPDRLDQPLRWQRPRKVFVNSLSDLFHDAVPDEFIARVFAIMALTERHTFQILTKRHARMRSLLNSAEFQQQVGDASRGLVATGKPERAWDESWPLPNVWMGVTVEDQKHADLRIPALMETPAAARFLSCEPLLGPVDLTPCNCRGTATSGCARHNPGSLTDTQLNERSLHVPAVDWVIVGGESGTDARPMHPDWARNLRNQCASAGIPLVFKQWGEWAPTDHVEHRPAATSGLTGKTPRGGHKVIYLDRDGIERSTNDLTTFTIPDGWARLARVGKRAAGRELDGQLWDQYPSSNE